MAVAADSVSGLQTSTKDADRDECSLFASGWSTSEKDDWTTICVKGELSAGGRSLRSGFIRELLTKQPFKDRLAGRGLKIFEAVFNDDLDLSFLAVDPTIVLKNDTFFRVVDLSRSTFKGSVILLGSSLDEGLRASGASVSGSLLLGKSDENDISSENLMKGEVNGGYIDARELRVGDNLGVVDMNFTGCINFSNSIVSGSTIITRTLADKLDMSASVVDGQVIIIDSEFSNSYPCSADDLLEGSAISLYSLHTKQAVYLNRSKINGPLSIESLQVGSDVLLLGASLRDVAANNSIIPGALMLGSQKYRYKPYVWWSTSWQGGSTLDLTGAVIGTIEAPNCFDAWPDKINLTGFSAKFYQTKWQQQYSHCREKDWLISWLGLQVVAIDHSTQPYEVGSRMLEASGDREGSAHIKIAQYNNMLGDSLRKHDFLRGFFLLALKIVVGYGYDVPRALIWWAAFVVTGALVFRRTPEARKARMPYGVVYSIDMLLPIIRLRETNYKIDIAGPSRYYFYIHRTAGWVLGTLVGVGLSGIVK